MRFPILLVTLPRGFSSLAEADAQSFSTKKKKQIHRKIQRKSHRKNVTACNFIQRGTLTHVISLNFVEFFGIAFFRTPLCNCIWTYFVLLFTTQLTSESCFSCSDSNMHCCMLHFVDILMSEFCCHFITLFFVFSMHKDLNHHLKKNFFFSHYSF